MAVSPERWKAQLPLKLSEVISPYPVPPFRLCPHVPALGTHSRMPGTPCCCCLSCRLRYSKSSLMSLYCPALVQGDVLSSHPASLLPQAIFRTLHLNPFFGAKKEAHGLSSEICGRNKVFSRPFVVLSSSRGFCYL